MKSYEELKAMSEKDLEEYLSKMINGIPQDARPEVMAKKILILQKSRQNRTMVKCTKLITGMTFLMLLLTVANVIFLLMSLNII